MYQYIEEFVISQFGISFYDLIDNYVILTDITLLVNDKIMKKDEKDEIENAEISNN